MSSEPTDQKQKPWLFAAGQSGNPAGRPKGSRNKLAEAFTADLLSDWEENGAQAIRDARAESPVQYLKVIASVVPKEFKIEAEPLADLSDDDLERLIGLIRAAESGTLSVGDDPRTPGRPH